jgi:hypothetical protein
MILEAAKLPALDETKVEPGSIRMCNKRSNRVLLENETLHRKSELASAKPQPSLWVSTILGLERVRRYQLLLAESKIPTAVAIPAAMKLNVSLKSWVVQSRIKHMAP